MTLEERIEGLEQELAATKRRYQVHLTWEVVIILILVTCVILWTSTPSGNVIRADRFIARSFVVEGWNGKARAELAVSKYVFPAPQAADRTSTNPAPEEGLRESLLVLYDDNGNQCIRMGANTEGASLSLSDGHGKQRVALDAGFDRTALDLLDGKGVPRTGLVVTRDEPGISVWAANGKPVWAAPASQKAP